MKASTTEVFVVTNGLSNTAFTTNASLLNGGTGTSSSLNGTLTQCGTATATASNITNSTTTDNWGKITGPGTINITSGGYIGTGVSYPSYPSSTLDIYTNPTYNEFWKFNEEFDLLWKSFFDTNSVYKSIKEKVVNHPCDIQETDNGLRIEIAAVGLDKDEVEIITDSETLRIAYRKSEEEKELEKNAYRYLHRSIKKASFDIAWKISSKYELSKLEAKLEKGLLVLDIPFAKENKPKKVTIK